MPHMMDSFFHWKGILCCMMSIITDIKLIVWRMMDISDNTIDIIASTTGIITYMKLIMRRMMGIFSNMKSVVCNMISMLYDVIENITSMSIIRLCQLRLGSLHSLIDTDGF